jgi:hypothetical protein
MSDTISPRLIVTGFDVDHTKHCCLEFWAYVQIDEEHYNSMATRTTGMIALRPTGNTQGGHYYMSLTTGRWLNQNWCTELPMLQDFINRVHTLARRSQANRALLFADHNGDPILDDNDA